MLNVRHVELFWYVAKHGGITPALPHIPWHPAQPTVTEALDSLEEQWGGKLLIRKPFCLLEDGHALFAIADPFFSSLAKLLRRAARSGDRELKIACSHAVHPYLSDIFGLLKERYPAFTIQMRAASQVAMLQMLVPGAVDLVIAPIDGPVPRPVSCTPLVALPLALVVLKHSPVRSANEFWAAPDKLPRLAIPYNSESVVASFERGLAALHVKWPPTLESDGLLAVPGFVTTDAADVGLTLNVPSCVAHPGVRVLPLPGFDPVTVGVYCCNPASELATLLINVLLRRAQLTWPVDRNKPPAGLRGHSRRPAE